MYARQILTDALEEHLPERDTEMNLTADELVGKQLWALFMAGYFIARRPEQPEPTT